MPSDLATRVEGILHAHYATHDLTEWVSLVAALADENAQLQIDIAFYRSGKGG